MLHTVREGPLTGHSHPDRSSRGLGLRFHSDCAITGRGKGYLKGMLEALNTSVRTTQMECLESLSWSDSSTPGEGVPAVTPYKGWATSMGVFSGHSYGVIRLYTVVQLPEAAVWVSDGEDEDDATVPSDNGEPKEDDADEEDADARAIAVPSLEGFDDLDGAPETERVITAAVRPHPVPAGRVHLARRDGEYVLNRFGNNAAATAGADADANAVGGKVADYAALPVAGAEVPVSGSVFGYSSASENVAPIRPSAGIIQGFESPIHPWAAPLVCYGAAIVLIRTNCTPEYLASSSDPALGLTSQTTMAAHYRICPVPRARGCRVLSCYGPYTFPGLHRTVFSFYAVFDLDIDDII
ncbi:hypothetical protein B0H11DRAFT_1930652 [Mycena galericulata]|nr:hypothetical protein B0H11DRAFT_1930652 [Mycena galericulata]